MPHVRMNRLQWSEGKQSLYTGTIKKNVWLMDRQDFADRENVEKRRAESEELPARYKEGNRRHKIEER